jgi:two-component system, sporulation sensor kinase E
MEFDKKIDDLKKHLRLLSERKSLYQKVIDVISEGVLVINQRKDILLYNYAFIKHMNIPNYNNLSLQALHDNQVFKKILEETKEFDFANYARDVEIFMPQKKHLTIRAVCQKENSDKYIIYIVFDNLLIRQKGEENLNKQKMGAVLTLGAGLAHELGNPLNSLMIHLEVMNKHLKELKYRNKDLLGVKKEAGVLESEIKRMDSVIYNFLKAVRSEKIQYKEIEIVETIRIAIESIVRVAEQNKVFIEFTPAMERKFIFADAQKIQQVIINIIKNAIEAIKENGKINVLCREENGYIIIEVKDNGPGITEEDLPRIFDPFFTTKNNGTGLGLAISYRIVREHDGDLSVKSSPGSGTAFQVRLPLREYKLKLLESKKTK